MSHWYKGKYKNLEAIIIENESLKAVWVPQYGAKLASLQFKTSQGFKEVFVQSKHETLLIPSYGASFADFDVSGFDECFPTIDECLVTLDGVERVMPDHGEVWAMPWQVSDISGKGFNCKVYSPNFGYTLFKNIRLNGSIVTIQYQLRLNDERQALPFIWTPHALFKIYQGTQIMVPKQMKSITNVSHFGGRLGEYGTQHNYPTPNGSGLASLPIAGQLDLRVMESQEANNCEKYYFNEKLKTGDRFGFRNRHFELMMDVDSETIPYLGVFKNQGGLSDYCFAIEPCSGIFDSTELAFNRGTCAVLNSGQTESWKLNISLAATNVETSNKQ
jgi:galactose mutarotase-like enzyme